MSNNELLIEYACQSGIILGWFWLIMFTILRAENFKKRYFSILVLIYFMQGVVKVSELVLIDVLPETFSGFNLISNGLCILGFTLITIRYIKFKKYFDEKHNLDISRHPDSDGVRGTESPTR